MKLASTAAFEALSDIRHDRYGSSLDLPCKSEIFGKRPLLANRGYDDVGFRLVRDLQ